LEVGTHSVFQLFIALRQNARSSAASLRNIGSPKTDLLGIHLTFQSCLVINKYEKIGKSDLVTYKILSWDERETSRPSTRDGRAIVKARTNFKLIIDDSSNTILSCKVYISICLLPITFRHPRNPLICIFVSYCRHVRTIMTKRKAAEAALDTIRKSTKEEALGENYYNDDDEVSEDDNEDDISVQVDNNEPMISTEMAVDEHVASIQDLVTSHDPFVVASTLLAALPENANLAHEEAKTLLQAIDLLKKELQKRTKRLGLNFGDGGVTLPDEVFLQVLLIHQGIQIPWQHFHPRAQRHNRRRKAN
jgi:hypothetical protein